MHRILNTHTNKPCDSTNFAPSCKRNQLRLQSLGSPSTPKHTVFLLCGVIAMNNKNLALPLSHRKLNVMPSANLGTFPFRWDNNSKRAVQSIVVRQPVMNVHVWSPKKRLPILWYALKTFADALINEVNVHSYTRIYYVSHDRLLTKGSSRLPCQS